MMSPVIVMAEDIETFPDYVVLPIEAGDIVPFDGVLLSLDAAAKIVTEKKFESAECDLRIGYELHVQEEKYQLQLDYKDIEIVSWKDKYESMMILKSAENDRLTDLIIKQKPGKDPFMVALGFGIGTLTSLGIFALSTELVQ
jgi:hypothetical protein|tara:strand:- start:69 stop:494 length:426 start_codon:yes stop_codon:yes gene_type:complete